MRQIPLYGDERELAFCAYCGALPESRDHVPSRVLLDEPFPDNLPHVPACRACNEGFSLDEEYLACLVECILAGSTEPVLVKRPKVARLLSAKPSLGARIAHGMSTTDKGTLTTVEPERVRKVVLKLARGHAFYEQHVAHHDEPSHVWFGPLALMSAGERSRFEHGPVSVLSIWPEVGSRAMQRLVEGDATDGWIVAQPGRYRYATALDGAVVVRGVLSEYLGFEVAF